MELISKHKGTNSENVHGHQKWAKYVFMSSGRVPGEYTHSHTHDPSRKQFFSTIAVLADHIHKAQEHRDVDEFDLPEVDEDHLHEYKAHNYANNFASALYVNKLSLDLNLFPQAEVVFFVIEGSFKCNAILSKILETGVPAAVFSVPSVYAWSGLKELKTAVQGILKDKPIVIVPDADWAKNWAVNTAANLCRMQLVRYGADPDKVFIAAPPLNSDGSIPEAWNPYKVQENDEHTAYEIVQTMEETKGVDDFLGFGEGNLGDLQVNGYKLPDEQKVRLFIMEHFAASGIGSQAKSASLRNCVHVLRALSSFQACRNDNEVNPENYIQVSARTLGNAIGIHHEVAVDTLEILKGSGAIDVEGEYSDQEGEFGFILERKEDFPKITVQPEWQSEKTWTKPLRNFFSFLV